MSRDPCELRPCEKDGWLTRGIAGASQWWYCRLSWSRGRGESWVVGWVVGTIVLGLVASRWSSGWLFIAMAVPIGYRTVDLFAFHARLLTLPGAPRGIRPRRTLVLEAVSLVQVIASVAFVDAWRNGAPWHHGFEHGARIVLFQGGIPTTEPLTRWLVNGAGVVLSLMILTCVISTAASRVFPGDGE